MLVAVDAETLAETSIDAWHVIGAIVVLIVGWILSRVTRRAARKLLMRLGGVSETLRELTARTLGYLVLFLGVGIALALIGVPIQPVLSVAIIVGVILALALRGLADNFAAGIIIQTEQPIHIGDEVDSLEFTGIVKDLTTRSVVIETFDGKTVFLPNGEVLNNPLINHTTVGARRSEIEVRVATDDPTLATARLMDTLTRASDVFDDPAPGVHLVAIDPDRATYRILFWHRPDNEISVTSELVQSLAAALGDAGAMATIISPRPVAPLTPSTRV